MDRTCQLSSQEATNRGSQSHVIAVATPLNLPQLDVKDFNDLREAL